MKHPLSEALKQKKSKGIDIAIIIGRPEDEQKETLGFSGDKEDENGNAPEVKDDPTMNASAETHDEIELKKASMAHQMNKDMHHDIASKMIEGEPETGESKGGLHNRVIHKIRGMMKK